GAERARGSPDLAGWIGPHETGATMGTGSTVAGGRTRVVVLTADSAFEQSVQTTFSTSPQIDLTVIQGALAGNETRLDAEPATVVVIDIDAGQAVELEALRLLMGRIGGSPPVGAVTPAVDARRAPPRRPL